jgi:hypothetical protein
LIITLAVKKNAIFFAKKLAKIAENCDHNIDPWLLNTICIFLNFVSNCVPSSLSEQPLKVRGSKWLQS